MIGATVLRPATGTVVPALIPLVVGLPSAFVATAAGGWCRFAEVPVTPIPDTVLSRADPEPPARGPVVALQPGYGNPLDESPVETGELLLDREQHAREPAQSCPERRRSGLQGSSRQKATRSRRGFGTRHHACRFHVPWRATQRTVSLPAALMLMSVIVAAPATPDGERNQQAARDGDTDNAREQQREHDPPESSSHVRSSLRCSTRAPPGVFAKKSWSHQAGPRTSAMSASTNSKGPRPRQGIAEIVLPASVVPSRLRPRTFARLAHPRRCRGGGAWGPAVRHVDAGSRPAPTRAHCSGRAWHLLAPQGLHLLAGVLELRSFGWY
jgi:hypothetical protein